MCSIITDNGTNVGVGTTTPNAKLEVNGGAMLNSGATDGPRMMWRGGAGGTQAYNARVATGGHLGFFPIEAGNPGFVGEVLALTQGGNVGINNVTAPTEKLEVNGNGLYSGSLVGQGFATAEIALAENASLTGPDNSYHTVTCPTGFAMMNLGIYASSRLDGGERINCMKLNDLLTTTETWRGLGAQVSAPGTGTNTLGNGADNQVHGCSCAAGEVATGFELSSSDRADGQIKLRCTALRAPFILANNGTVTINGGTVRGVMSALSHPWDNGADNQYHISNCPTGTFVTAITISASDRLDGGVTCYCSGIKK